jgi:hypothetical protein
MSCDLPPKPETAKETNEILASIAKYTEAIGDQNDDDADKPHYVQVPKWEMQVASIGFLSTETHVPTPQTVTSLSFSKGAQRLFVGDVAGRVFSWGFSEGSGKVAAHWMKDSQANGCMSCSVKFSFSERKHHCRNCGKVFCQKCSALETAIPALQITKPVRVCNPCYNALMSATPLNDDSD